MYYDSVVSDLQMLAVQHRRNRWPLLLPPLTSRLQQQSVESWTWICRSPFSNYAVVILQYQVMEVKL